ncbi:shufflon system plasmid conjugative transfer pilus tip adhesin PilV [Salmonella enterica]|nr:shufflon system plasmid conjugative transfer pilus tip adhesin PilV [Salmonella enterica]EKA8564085.1 shufflon system plasmid conjugative transfer pilus tip adhesin PilV [Salmonella enterica]EKK2130374.1 shufflon system plasmid conjugative transfer pilus tip adhesin PilV [Salmonella enterica]
MKKQKHDGGFVAMSVGAGLLIVLVMASMAARYMGDYLKSREWQVVAMQTNRFTQAATSYVGRYYPTVLASATTTTPVVVTTQMLKNTGLLPASFSETNSYGQQYQAMIVRNQQNQALLQGMVVSRGGHAMPFTALNQISKDITAGFGGYVEDGQTAVGAMRSWRIALSSYGTSTGRGHLAVLLSTDDLSGAREDGDRLYRFQVNGRPDLNKMHTAIDMGGNNLNNAGTVAAQNGNFGVSLVSNGPVTAGGDIRSTGGWIVTRSGKGWMDETHGGGFYMSDNDWVRSVNNKGIYTGGQLKGGSVRSDSDLAAGGILKLDRVSVAGTWCPQNGAISHDSRGGILSCQSGIWRTNAKFDGSYGYIGAFQYSYSAVNRSDKAIMVYASGGTSVRNKKVKDGDNCVNTWALEGQVNGSSIIHAQDANSEWNKSGSISFLVPSGSAWSVISNPLPSYGCSPGQFSISVFTLH